MFFWKKRLFFACFKPQIANNVLIVLLSEVALGWIQPFIIILIGERSKAKLSIVFLVYYDGKTLIYTAIAWTETNLKLIRFPTISMKLNSDKEPVPGRLVSIILAALAVVLVAWVIFPQSFQGDTSYQRDRDEMRYASLVQSSHDDKDQPVTNEHYQAHVLPLLKRYCIDCHEGELAEGIFDVEKFGSLDALKSNFDVWEKVAEQVRDGVMPPADSTPFADKEKQSLLAWSDAVLSTRPGRPGTITLRRLTRYEYRNTIRDLLGVDYETADEFPADDVGYGFDNIGDVLSLPPILMEKYLAAAEEITAKAIVDEQLLKVDSSLDMSDFRGGRGSRNYQSGFAMSTNGKISTVFDFKARGDYKAVVSAAAQQAGDEPAEMSFYLGDKKIKTVQVTNDLGERADYEFSFHATKGKWRVEVSFDNDFYRPAEEGRRAQDRNLYIGAVQLKGPNELDHRDLPDNYSLVFGNHSEAKERIARLLKRSYRRPPTEHEINRFNDFYERALKDTKNKSMAMRIVVQAMLVSPNFLFKVEQPAPNDGSVRQLDHHEIASSLSYFIWRTMPDDELFALAEQKRLTDPQVLAQQVDRMLVDPKAKSLSIDFVDQCFQLRLLEDVSPDPDMFPEFSDQVREDMRTETRMLFEHIVENDKSLFELLSANYSFLNSRLADLYGIEGVRGPRFRKVSLGDTNRTGILTHAGILTLTSNPNRTSPVKRGKWVMETILGKEPPPPDPNVAPLENQPELKGTLRQRMEQHRADPTCAVCHQQMDPIGFAMENFDAIGRWREKDDGNDIDASGALPNGFKFNGAGELTDMFVHQYREDFAKSMTKKMMTYALGRGLEYYDRPAIDKIVKSMGDNGWTVRSMIHGIVQSEPFLKRQKIDDQNE